MEKTQKIVWYDWVGPSGYEESTYISEHNPVPAATSLQPIADTKRRIVLSGRCNCNSRIAVCL